MVVVDANVLLYAVNAESPRHDASCGWLERALSGEETVGFAWTVLLAFVRLATSHAVFPEPMGTDDAIAQIRRWLDQPGAVVLEPAPSHLGTLAALLAASGTAGNLTNDAHLAALALEHGAAVVSFDRDFARFEGVEHRLPAPRA